MSTEEQDPQTDTISLLDLIEVVAKRRWMIVAVSAAAAVLITLYSVYSIVAPADAPLNKLPNMYAPEVKIRLQDIGKNLASSQISSGELSILASIAGSVGTPSSADLAQELLKGNALLDTLTDEFGIVGRLGDPQYPRTAARQYLRKAITMDYRAQSSILTVRFEDTDRHFAAAVLSRALELLEGRFDELTLGTVNDKKRFLEESVGRYERELKAAQQNLIDFQRTHGVINIELQAEYQLSAIAALDSEILKKESQIQALRAMRQPGDSEVRRLEMELDVIRTMRDSRLYGAESGRSGLDIPQSELPELAARWVNLSTDLRIVQTIYSGLRAQYESIRMEELDTSARFQVVEKAEVPEIKSRPSRGRICVIVTLSAFFLSVFYAFILEYFERVKGDPVESEKLSRIKGMLRLFRKK